MNFCLQIINYSESFLLQLCGCLLGEGGRASFIFLMYTLNTETKIKCLAHLVGVPVPREIQREDKCSNCAAFMKPEYNCTGGFCGRFFTCNSLYTTDSRQCAQRLAFGVRVNVLSEGHNRDLTGTSTMSKGKLPLGEANQAVSTGLIASNSTSRQLTKWQPGLD